MTAFPPQAPPVHRRQVTPAHTTIDLDPRTEPHLERVRAWLRYNANINDPAAYCLPSSDQAGLSAR